MTRSEQPNSLLLLFSVATLLTLAFVFIFLGSTFFAAASLAYVQTTSLVEKLGYSVPQLVAQTQAGLSNPPLVDHAGHKNFLLLGLDTLESRTDSKPLTDTVLLLSLDTSENTVNMLSFPRDLWSDSYKSKINALYAEAIDQGLQPNYYIEDEIERLGDLNIHHTVVITMDMVGTLIDSLGGVTIDVQEPFTDPLFPRSDVDVTKETDPSILYETISFEAGVQHMNGERALKYLRSKHASGKQGSDLARSIRQQQVLSAVFAHASNPTTLLNETTILTLGRQYRQIIEPTLPISELVSTSYSMVNNAHPITFQSNSLPIYPDIPSGVLYHPQEYLYQGQWVYTIRDKSEFSKTVKQLLGYSETNTPDVRKE